MVSWFTVLLALFAASLEPVLAKVGYGWNVNPWQLMFLKSTFGALVFLPWARRCRLPRDQWPSLLRVAGLLALTQLATLWSLRSLPAVTLITLTTATPAVVAIVNHARGRHALGRLFWIGFWTSVTGVLLSLEGLSELRADGLGLSLALIAVASSSVYRTLLEDVTARVPPVTVSTCIFLVHGVLAVCLLGPFISPIPAPALGIGLWLGVAAALANLAFLQAIQQVGSTNMSLFNLLQRPLVVVAAGLVLGESVAATQWLGLALVLLGVRWAQVHPKSRPDES